MMLSSVKWGWQLQYVCMLNFIYYFKSLLVVGEAEVQKYMFTYHTEGQFHFMFILYL